MSAFYDTYDYPAYWTGREYEHEAEVIALKAYLDKIGKVETILEVGAGYGRLTSTYLENAKNVILSDPSAKLLAIAKQFLKDDNLKFFSANLENLPKKIKAHSVDTLIMVRVLHHIDDLDKTFLLLNSLIKKNGYLILEFANKCHLKATLTEFFKGNLTFLLDIFTKDLRIKTKKINPTIPFNNYHPDVIYDKLKKNNFKIVEVRSVSNIRSPLLKKIFPKKLLLLAERSFQKPLAKIAFGPSLFVLAKSKD